MVGEEFYNSNNRKFKVLKLSKVDKNYKKYYDIEFCESGYIATDVRSDTIKGGLVRDKLEISKCGVGRVGYANTKKNEREHRLWSCMLNRCYRQKDISYPYYGAKGVTVCDRWLRFDYFLEDMPKIDGYNESLFKKGKLELDKDIKHKNTSEKKQYCLENCTFVSQVENQKKRAEEQNCRKRKIAIHPDGKEELITHLKDFCKTHNLQQQNISLCLSGKNKQHKGFKFKYE